MEKNIDKITDAIGSEDKISRKEAILKVGKYAAVTAASTMLILSPKLAQAGSGSPNPPGKKLPSKSSSKARSSSKSVPASKKR